MQTKLEHIESPVTLTLTMSRQEARVLRTVCYRIAGSAAGPRGTMVAIGDLLAKHGIMAYEHGVTGSIQFPHGYGPLEGQD